MAGSQAMMTAPLTWRATQAAAWSLAAVALLTGVLLARTLLAGAGPSADARCGWDSTWPASTASTADRAASAPAPAIRSRRAGRAAGGAGPRSSSSARRWW
jgi:hypothetical protein